MTLRRRHLAIAASVVLLCAGFALVASTTPIWTFLTLIALLLGAGGLLFSFLNHLRLQRMQGDLDRLGRSLDSALKELAEGHRRNVTSIGALSDAVDRQIEGVLGGIL